MGKYNDALCRYLSNPKVFADYWNGIFFHGDPVLDPDDLSDWDGTYYTLPKGRSSRTKERRRDVIKKAKTGATYVILGIENQKEISYILPARAMEYDAMEYSRQIRQIAERNMQEAKQQRRKGGPPFWHSRGEFLSRFRKEDRLAPVITVFFYHGLDPYDGYRELHSMLNFHPDIEKYHNLIPNYTLNIITLAEIQEENLKTGLRELIGVMKRSADKKSLQSYCQEQKERFWNLDEETIDTMAIMLNEDALKFYKREEGGIDMCKALEDIRQEGRSLGLAEGARAVIKTCLDLGTSREDAVSRAVKLCGVGQDEAEKLADAFWK